MKRFLIFVVYALLLCGCSKLPDTYPFLNEDNTITSIALFYFHNPQEGYVGQEFELIRELEIDEITPFMDGIRSIDTIKGLSPPPCGFGEYIAQVTYSDGSMELFGTWHMEYVKSGDEILGIGAYNFMGDAFEKLFLEYAGELSYLKQDN